VALCSQLLVGDEQILLLAASLAQRHGGIVHEPRSAVDLDQVFRLPVLWLAPSPASDRPHVVTMIDQQGYRPVRTNPPPARTKGHFVHGLHPL
jgi:hypothetical protein